MNIFDRIIQGSVFSDVWQQVQLYLFSEKRWRQLLSFKPIEIYTTKTDIEIDGAKIDLNIKAYIENIVQKRISNVKSYLSLGFLNWNSNRQQYKFNFVVKAKTDYSSVGNFFTHHFSNIRYTIEENKYDILFKKFIVKNSGTKVQIDIPFIIFTNKWYLKKQYEGNAVFMCSLIFNDPAYTIKTRNLAYSIQTKSTLIKWINSIYYNKIINFLNNFLIYNYKEELYLAKLQAQHQLNDFQIDRKWFHGIINDINLERITIDHDALRAVFFANGKIEVNN